MQYIPRKKSSRLLPSGIGQGLTHLRAFALFFFLYLRRKILRMLSFFERQKNRLVKFFTTKRGRYNRPFLHMATMGVLAIGIIIAPFLADTFPVSGSSTFSLPLIKSASAEQSIIVGDNVLQTDISQKPRDKVIDYAVEQGDTISSIGKKFGISADTIRWENDLNTDDVTVGDTLKILPVTGIAHKVEPGDSVYSIAKTYGTDPQQIVDFPFNEFANPETFTLVTGEVLIVPNGVKPSEVSTYKNLAQDQYSSQYSGSIPLAAGGYDFPVPANTGISQYFSWFHSGTDITGPIGTPIYAAHSGTVSIVHVGTYDTGYGTNVYIDDGDGVVTHYAHLQSVNVSVGQSAVGGKTIVGWIGMTGRTTGPHLHFEIKRNGVFVDPLQFVGQR